MYITSVTPYETSSVHIKAFIIEYYGKSLTQTNQTKQKFISLYYLDCWIERIQCDEQKKSSTKCIVVQMIQFDELLFCLICLGKRISIKLNLTIRVIFRQAHHLTEHGTPAIYLYVKR